MVSRRYRMLDWALGKFWLLFGVGSILLIVGGLKSLGPNRKQVEEVERCSYWNGLGQVGLIPVKGRTGLHLDEVEFLLETQTKERILELIDKWGRCE